MKKYTKNKDFIPEGFHNLRELNKRKVEGKILMLFVILNLLLTPFTAEKIISMKERPSTKVYQIKNTKQSVIDFNDVNVMLESVLKDAIEEIYITNNSGKILVDNFDKINEVSSNDFIKICDINLDENKKYELGVSLNE